MGKRFIQKTGSLLIFLFSAAVMHAQGKLYTKEARVSFFSRTAMENIEAQNNKGLCVWDTDNGQFECSVLIKGFEFDRALMQEHFNENYMESDAFPKAFFKGTLVTEKPFSKVKDNSFKAQVNGILTLHGVAKPVSVPATIDVKNNVVHAEAVFTVLTSDYKISIPSLVADKIDKKITIKITVPAFKNL